MNLEKQNELIIVLNEIVKSANQVLESLDQTNNDNHRKAEYWANILLHDSIMLKTQIVNLQKRRKKTPSLSPVPCSAH